MADKNPRLIRQGQYPLHRCEHGGRRTTGKIAAGSAEIGHEQSVANKGGVADDIGQAGGGMAGGVHDIAAQLANLNAVTIGKQAVELRAVALKLGAFIEHFAEGILDIGDPGADADFAAELLLDIGRCRQMIGVDVGFQYPLQIEVGFADEVDHGVGGPGVGATRGIIKIQYRIDDSAGATVRIAHDIGDCVGRLVKKGGNFGFHGGLILTRKLVIIHSDHEADIQSAPRLPKVGQFLIGWGQGDEAMGDGDKAIGHGDNPGPVRQDVLDGVLVLTLCHPPVNALGAAVRVALGAALDRAERDAGIKAVVIRGDGRAFSAGADIREFGQRAQAPLLPELCRRIEGFAKPVIAAMHGVALGGGFELGLAAHARVGMAGLRVGLPEVNLGLLPGAGGTQRLPRLIGADVALRMMLTGQPITAEDALTLGVLDAVAPDADGLLAAALVLADAPPAAGRRTGFRDPAAFAAAVAAARKEAAKSGSAAKARIVDCVEAALLLPLDQGLTFERAAFDDLRASPEAAALRYGFLADRRADHLPTGYDAAAAVPVAHLGIWGAGAAAVGLVGAALKAGLKVTLCDPSREALVSALEAVGLAQEAEVSAGRLTADARDGDWARLFPAVDPMAFAGVEAIILTDAERPLAVDFARGLAQDITVMVAGGVPNGAGPDVMGVVFAQGGLAEVALLDGMSPRTIATGLGLLRKLGLRPIRTGLRGQGPGIGARVTAAGRQAAQVLIRSGVPVAQVTRAVAAFMRLPSGLAEGQGALMAIKDAAIADRVLAAMANEGARLLSDGTAQAASDIDVVMVAGYGFSRVLAGPMYQADARGLMVMRRNLRIWAVEDAIWTPDPLFDTLIADGSTFASLNEG
jgi:3-hydroxyacyl-CoA dehydrogenase